MIDANEVINTSVTVAVFRFCHRHYTGFEDRIVRIYQQSRTCFFIKEISARAGSCLVDSLLGRVSDLSLDGSDALRESLVARRLLGIRRLVIKYLNGGFGQSLFYRAEENMRKEFLSSPLRLIAVTIISAVVVNIVISLSLNIAISGWGWVMRFLFLGVGFAGLFSSVDWGVICRGSRVLGKANRKDEEGQDT